MSVYLLGGYLRSGAAFQEHFLIFDINGIREGRTDVNGGVTLLVPVPPNRLVTEIDDPGDLPKTAAVVLILEHRDMKPQLVSQAFDTAINDGINIYMRDVVREKGFISQANHERLWEQDMLPRKYRIAAQLAQERARMPLPQPVSRAFDAAIADGINTFIRDVVLALGFISEENYARLGEQDLLPLKCRISSELGEAWAKMPLIREDTEHPSS